MECRICWTSVRKSAMFCQGCNLICHSHCVNDAPSSCDVHEQVRVYAEHARQAASSPPPPTEPRGRKLSIVKRSSVPTPATSQPMAGSASSPPTSYPYSVMTTGWRKIRNSTSSMAGTDLGAMASSPPTTPRVSEELERQRDSSNHARLGTDQTGTTTSSGVTSSSGSGVQSDDGGSRRAISVSLTVNSSQAPSARDENSLPRNTPAPEANTNAGTTSQRPKRKPKGAETSSSCIMQ